MPVRATSVADYSRIKVEPVTGAIGAEISNVDLGEVDDDTLAELKHAWLDHKVLFFRDQELTQAQHVAYGALFGELEVHPFTPNVDDHPEIIILESTPEEFSSASLWHSDVTFRESPPLGSVLFGRIIPPYGGDTCFANQELVYEQLPDDIKEQIDGRVGIHSYVKAFGRNMNDEQKAKAYEEFPDQKHPMVRTHPETGRQSLFVNRGFTLTIDGMDEDEAERLLQRLYRETKRPQYQCRFRWQPNSIAQWDNRCTQHYAVPDYQGFHRRVERVTLIGDRPV